MLHRFESSRLIRVDVSKKDDRRKNVTLSTQGRTLVERVAAEVAGLDRAVFEGKTERVRLHHSRDTLMDTLANVEQWPPSPSVTV